MRKNYELVNISCSTSAQTSPFVPNTGHGPGFSFQLGHQARVESNLEWLEWVHSMNAHEKTRPVLCCLRC
ncbi:hypothetical protein I7I50_03080 [Histoplasma capsulatum G186AR]|uniref:Uncharacterized protein n=1 Tax=Ajellomyces capsulatus TaxID=5037 RepID=A0A8H7Z4D3_AJECA|nr:hypothetical protein I7I52_00254 [Histoplasma capsulatum]QSS72029.1 hypothetical protein I7I50_03080 [Histoplasma capsulatum G186AR]